MVFKVVRSADSDRDLGLIFDHLIESYIALGDPLADAFDRAAARLHTIEGDMEALAQAPYQGTLLPDVAPGLRQVTKNRAIFNFDLDEERQVLRVLAIFFGGQDHLRRYLTQLGRAE
ncbi:type II toxin-antitoxin system RelE/ParE family toxin [Rhizobium sp. AB2/73]|uniref:type II toxin-antitoxin system RelE/ParE family toxin n=1 Tax=Rhizobium sp. AB2/73 TaxID=2795216 RepID=UPI000DE04E57|nr:type II toxin-antitoxin system RelE/ParE family toxin [Rhizobium sp. AB2/73]QYA16578.1 type II toxin-antitoxin system RelE/ParE family toxin [Rhizobium sp. AB2/73]UEQ84226.1 type II toxin-antitoxin system RelE/ParE family toxin [Rhizobium sp. AB2/73]